MRTVLVTFFGVADLVVDEKVDKLLVPALIF